MTISEEARHQLYLQLESAIGRAEANTLMEHLPPVGWADVATKRDLDQLGENIEHLRQNMDLRLDQLGETVELKLVAVQVDLHRELAEVRLDFEHALRTLTWQLALAMFTLVSIVFVAAAVTRL